MNIFHSVTTSGEAQLTGELIARICDQLNGRKVKSIEPYNGRVIANLLVDEKDRVTPDIKLIFETQSNKKYSKYTTKRLLKKKVKSFFDNVIDGKDLFKSEPFNSEQLNVFNNNEVVEDDLPF